MAETKSKHSKKRMSVSERRKAKPQKRQLVKRQIQSIKAKRIVNKSRLFVIGVMCLAVLSIAIRVIPHRVDGQSMNPTLANNDRIFVLKNNQPKRYSIITFRPKEKPKESYVKRVIGLPGDAIWLDNNTLYINQQLVSDTEQPPANSDLLGRKLPDGTIKVWLDQKLIKEFAGKRTIPEHKYFVLGDNRNHSSDSRAFGLVDASQIEGVVKWRYYPFNKTGIMD